MRTRYQTVGRSCSSTRTIRPTRASSTTQNRSSREYDKKVSFTSVTVDIFCSSFPEISSPRRSELLEPRYLSRGFVSSSMLSFTTQIYAYTAIHALVLLPKIEWIRAVNLKGFLVGWSACYVAENWFFISWHWSASPPIRRISSVFSSVQFHPEHMGGPRDLELLFDVFLEQVRAHKKNDKRYWYNSKITLENNLPAFRWKIVKIYNCIYTSAIQKTAVNVAKIRKVGNNSFGDITWYFMIFQCSFSLFMKAVNIFQFVCEGPSDCAPDIQTETVRDSGENSA